MNEPFQPLSRLLPFSTSPGGWKEWEKFWVNFLNSSPLLPWPGEKPTAFKRVNIAIGSGVEGGSQDGIDVMAEMDDGSILAVQCKDSQRYRVDRGVAAMDKAEREFAAGAYFLVLTQVGVPVGLRKEAEKRGNWLVIGIGDLSSWFFSGKFLDTEKQKELIEQTFGKAHRRALFPVPEDELLVSPARFFAKRNLITHDAALAGAGFKSLKDRIVLSASGEGVRVAIISAPGGRGKTRLLKAIADDLELKNPNRKVRFQSDTANAQAEDYGIRGDMFSGSTTLVDDAHRLENLRTSLLRRISESEDATLVIAARPNSLESLKKVLRDVGFSESDWECHDLPSLDFQSRSIIAKELAPDASDGAIHWLAEQSKDCILVCTAGAELINSGNFPDELIGTDDFKRKVFDHLVTTTLEALYPGNQQNMERAELVLRTLSILGTIQESDSLNKKIAEVIGCKSWHIDRMRPDLQTAGLLRVSRGRLRVIPDLLSDHLVYDTAYGDGNGRLQSLVDDVIKVFGDVAVGILFGNLAEAEWRAMQEGKSGSFLEPLWKEIRRLLADPENLELFGLLDEWRKFAIFQPERTLELAEVFLEHERDRVKKNLPTEVYQGFRYDAVPMHLGKLPDLLLPVALNHPRQRYRALDLLWSIGKVKLESVEDLKELPAAWQAIVTIGSLSNWEDGATKDVFVWLQQWAESPEGFESMVTVRPFMSSVALRWMQNSHSRSWKEAEIIRENLSEIEAFRLGVLDWLERKVIVQGVGASWLAANVISSSWEGRPRNSDLKREELTPIAAKGLQILSAILELNSEPVLRLLIWHRLSSQAATAGGSALERITKLRESIRHDIPFKLARLASGFAITEWNFERMILFEKRNDYEQGSQWWGDLAKETVIELREIHPTLRDAMEVLDRVDAELKTFHQYSRWDMIADAWVTQFPYERGAVIADLLKNPNRALVPCLGYFVAARDGLNSKIAVKSTLKLLDHPDGRIRRAMLFRLSWRDVTRVPSVATALKKMAASDNIEIVSDMTGYISSNQFEATAYVDESLSQLNIGILPVQEITKLGASIAHLIEYGKHPVGEESMTGFFRRLEQDDVEELQKILSQEAIDVFHDKFPKRMFEVHLSRIRSGQGLLWFTGEWSLDSLKNLNGYEAIARDLLKETLNAPPELFYNLRKLFDAVVGRVDAELAGDLLELELTTASLDKLVNLTGCGHGSIVYHASNFTKELLLKIDKEPKARADELQRELVLNAVPSMWGTCDGEVEEEYLWARDLSAQKSEEFRDDAILYPFYQSILSEQKKWIEASREKHLRDD